jgi:uncharacterized C2H2 Zn-finger protein
VRLCLPTDRQGFVRRRCPRCSREYKTRRTPEDAAACQQVVARLLPHANGDELSPFLPGPHCLYCGEVAAAVDTLTAAHRQYLEDVARSVEHWIRFERLRRAPRPTYLAVPPDPAPAPPKEADDLHPVHFLCCGDEAKSDSPRTALLRCPRCGALQQMGRGRIHLTSTVLDA